MNTAAPETIQKPPAWSASDGQRLRSLRERAGLDRGSLARACTISVAQLTELEDGGHGRFYNDHIKAHTGRNLLKRLGYVPESVPESMPEPVVADTAAVTPGPAPASDGESGGPALRNPWPLRAGIAVAVAATLVVMLMPRPSGETRPATDMAQARSPAPLPAEAASTTAGPASAPPSAAEATAPAPVASTGTAAATAAPALAQPEPRADATAITTQAQCDMPPRDKAVAYTSPSALRPDNYVYIESARETSVCVVDSQNRLTVSMVRPGESASVYGTPPFMVRSRQWAQLRVFYQGTRVTLDTASAPPAVLLTPR